MKPLFSLFLVVFISCSSESLTELDVINATFMEMVGTDYYNEPLPPWPYRPIHPDSIYNEIKGEIELAIELEGVEYEPKDSLTRAINQELERNNLLVEFNNFDWEQYREDSIMWHELLNHPKRDSRNIVLLVMDSLTTPKLDFLDLNNQLTPEGFQINFQLEDSWRIMALKLLDANLESEPMNRNELTNVGEYSLKSLDFVPSEKDRIAATLTFSRVIFNDSKDKACFYCEIYCGSECGYGYLVFVDRISGLWKLKEKREIWVS